MKGPLGKCAVLAAVVVPLAMASGALADGWTTPAAAPSPTPTPSPTPAPKVHHKPKIAIDPSPLTISGRVGEAGTLAGELRLTARSGEPQPYVVASDLSAKALANAAEPDPIGAPRVKIEQLTTAIPTHQERDVGITVEDVTQAGEYDGTLTVEADRRHWIVPLTVMARDRPTLALASASDKAITLLVSKAGGHTQRVDVPVTDASNEPAAVTDATVALHGQHHPDRTTSVSASPGIIVDPGGVASLPLYIDAKQLAPDHYTGDVLVRVTGTAVETRLPVDLDVKDGIWPAILWLLSGLVIAGSACLLLLNASRLNLHRQIKQTRRLAKVLPREDRAIVEALVASAEARLAAGDVGLAKSESDNAEKARELLSDAERYEASARALSGTVPDSVAGPLHEARGYVRDARFDKAKTCLDAAEEAVQKLRAARSWGPRPALGGTLTTAVGGAPIVPGLLISLAARLPLRPRAGWAVAGGNVLMLLILVAFVVLLVFLGLKALYFDNDTFGAQPLKDYGSLVAWGAGIGPATAGLGVLLPALGAVFPLVRAS